MSTKTYPKVKFFEVDEEASDISGPPPPSLANNGERQTSPDLAGIAPDHRKRYEWAAEGLAARKSALGLPSLRVLDAGCGNGYGSYILGRAGLNVDSRDVSEAAVRFARHHYSHPNVSTTCHDLQSCELGIYDAVVCFEVLEHLDVTVALERFRRALVPGGVLLVSVPNEEVVPFSPETHPFHLAHYTPPQFEALLRGWKVLERKSQADKWVGDIVDGWAGRTMIAVAQK